MSKRPPNALPADPDHPRAPRYIGQYVVWWDDGNWEWTKCVGCGQDLTTKKSRELGYGPSCALAATEAAKETILQEERFNAQAQFDATRRPVGRQRTRSRPADRALIRTVLNSYPNRGPGGGIQNEQAKTLARLQRAAGLPYSGTGMTAHEAFLEIQRLQSND